MTFRSIFLMQNQVIYWSEIHHFGWSKECSSQCSEEI